MELIRLRDSSGKIFDTAMKLYEKASRNTSRGHMTHSRGPCMMSSSILTLYMMMANL